MRAEIVSIGTEILLGEIVDTNAAFIASQLPEFGIDLLYVSQVGDNPTRLGEVLARAWERSDLTIASGGLGPTEDDVTREAVAAVLGEEVHVDDEQRALLEQRFGHRGAGLVERNMKQAWLIPSSRAIPNPRGTAPGWWVERDGHVIVLMPGPPQEMTYMWGAGGRARPRTARRLDPRLAHAQDRRPRRIDRRPDARRPAGQREPLDRHLRAPATAYTCASARRPRRARRRGG